MKTQSAGARFSSWLGGFAGIPRDGFFGTPAYVDTDKAPGHTPHPAVGPWEPLRYLALLSDFFTSPNLIWVLITTTVYILFPYDMAAAAQGWSLAWVGKRVAVTGGVALAYYSFFFWALYVRCYAERKFRPGIFPTVGNVMHDLWYWGLGVLQWSLSECAMTRLWATGALPYVSDEELLRSPSQLVVLVFALLAVPVWNDFHFYIAHRFIHTRAFYKYVHSVHHRDTDPEPFSGLCMHPVEHLLYFANALLPTLVVPVSPLLYTFMGLHRVLAPAGGHSGFEDAWNSNQYHWIHHAKFECNYGSPRSAWIDQLCGTFREKLGSSGNYQGEYKEDYAASSPKSATKAWSAQSYLGLQQGDHLAYTLFCAATSLLLAWAAAVNAPRGVAAVTHIGPLPIGLAVGGVVAYGPVAAALLLCAQFDKMSWRWPFHKERLVGTLGFFLLAGWSMCMLPVYKFVSLLCTP